MKFIKNTSKYVSSKIVEEVFLPGKIVHVDKVLCGNGFTTAFLDILHNHKKGINIIILPNVQAIMSKEEAYQKGAFKLKKIGFIYGKSENKSLRGKDTLCFVLDSFKLRFKDLKSIKIHRILVDEYHTVEQSASFRHRLQKFEKYLKTHYSHVAIATVTATPNMFSKIDIRIENQHIRSCEIHVTSNVPKTIKNIKNNLSDGKKVVVFITDKDVIHHLAVRNKETGWMELECNLRVGIDLQRKVVRVCKLTHNPESNLTLLSSNGFEGLDLYGKHNVFFFEKRYFDHRCFYISNLYQAINRVRDGADYIEYSRINKKTMNMPMCLNKIENFVKKDISTTKKQGKTYKVFAEYVSFHQEDYDEDSDTGIYTCEVNHTAYGLKKEEYIYDTEEFSGFKEFLELRKINIIDKRASSLGIRPSFPIAVQKAYLQSNEAYIKAHNLAGDNYRLNPKINENEIPKLLEKSAKKVEEYLALKKYDTGSILIIDRELYLYEEKALFLLKSPGEFENIYQMVKIKSKEYYKNKLSDREYRKKLKEINDENFRRVVVELLLSFINNVVYLASNYVGDRDYNASILTNFASVDYIAGILGRKLIEIDISEAFPRLIHALAGAEMPENFYGERKKNKRAVNILLNSLRYDEKKKEPKNRQRYAVVKKLKAFNFQEKVIDYLIDNWFEVKYKGDFFNHMAFHEKKIIRKLKKKLKEFDDGGSFRRHDSRIYVDINANVEAHIFDIVASLEYLGQRNWFKTSNFKSKFPVQRSVPF